MTNATSPARAARKKAPAAPAASTVPLLPDWWEPEWKPFDVIHNKGKDVLADIHETDPKGFELYVDALTAEIYGPGRLNELLEQEVAKAGYPTDEDLDIQLELDDLPSPRHALRDAEDPDDTDPDEADVPEDDPAYADAATVELDFKPSPVPRDAVDA
jgi:hypothetical protein